MQRRRANCAPGRGVVLMVRIQRYGRSRDWDDRNLDFVHVTNEDLAFNANLVTTTNDTFETTLPYPQEWDPEDEVMTLLKMEWQFNVSPAPVSDAYAGYGVTLSMIDRAASATFRGSGSDTDDEWMKSLFQSQMYAGRHSSHLADATGTEHFWIPADVVTFAEYVPTVKIPAFFPVYIEIFGASATGIEATGVISAADFTGFEATGLKYDYTIRKMSRSERKMFEGIPGVQQRWSQLGS